MTNQTLADVIYTSKLRLLSLNSTYINKSLIGSKFSMSRQIEILKAMDVYVDILEYYYDIQVAGVTDETALLSTDVDNLVELVTQCISSFKPSYYA